MPQPRGFVASGHRTSFVAADHPLGNSVGAIGWAVVDDRLPTGAGAWSPPGRVLSGTVPTWL